MDIRKAFYSEKVTKHWNQLPREVIVTILEISTRDADVVLRDVVQWGTQWCLVLLKDYCPFQNHAKTEATSFTSKHAE